LTDTPLGEIVTAALKKASHMLLMIEAKSPKIDVASKSILRQVKRTRKWCEKHKRKIC